MKAITSLKLIPALVFFWALNLYLFPALGQGTAFTYQGVLDGNGSPSTGLYDLRFGLYDSLTSGNQQGLLITNSAVRVTNGLFMVTLDFGATVFNGANRWLEVGVRTNGSVAAYAVLVPRQLVSPAPYAVRAANFAGAIADSQLSANVVKFNSSGTFSGAISLTNASNVVAGTGTALTLNASLISQGTLSDARLSTNIPLLNVSNYFLSAITVGRGANVISNSGTVNIESARVGNISDAGQLNFVNYDLNYGQSNYVAGRVSLRNPGVNGGELRFYTASNAVLTEGMRLEMGGEFEVFNGARLQDTPLLLRSGTDTNHGMAYFGNGTSFGGFGPDGPVLFGYSGGALGARQNGTEEIVAVWNNAGNFGIGTLNPQATLDVNGTANVAGALTVASARVTGTFTANSVVLTNLTVNAAVTVSNALTVGTVTIRTNLTVNSSATISGEVTTTAVNITSDRNAKENFSPVNPREVLEKVAALPVSEWQFKDHAERHIGPMAQDFRAAFNLGQDERHIATVDEDGVALAAIQGLNEKLQERDDEVAKLRRENQELAARLRQIETKLGLNIETK